MHLESVFRSIPHAQRCYCGYDQAKLPAMIEAAKQKSSAGPFPRAGQGGGCIIL